MQTLTKKLHYLTTSGETGSVTIYGEAAACPEPRLTVDVDGTTGYIKLGATTDAAATPVRVHLDSDGKDYAVLAEATLSTEVDNFVGSPLTIMITELPEDGA